MQNFDRNGMIDFDILYRTWFSKGKNPIDIGKTKFCFKLFVFRILGFRVKLHKYSNVVTGDVTAAQGFDFNLYHGVNFLCFHRRHHLAIES